MEVAEASTGVASGQVDLYVLGTGVAFPGHLSIETIEVLEKCSVILTNLPQTHLSQLPADLRAKSRSLWEFYEEGRNRSENYRRVVEEVLRTTESNRPTAWLTPGHPLIFDSVSDALLVQGRAQGWTVCMLPAISCLDTVLSEVEYDPARGLFIFEATSLVRRNVGIPPETAVLLLQPSVFNIDQALNSLDCKGPDLSLLRDHLLRFYGDTHPTAFVRSASRWSGPAQITRCELGKIANVPFPVLAGTTMFIPNP